MANSKKFTKTTKIVSIIVLTICAIWSWSQFADLTAKGNHLKEVCTESVMGNVWMLKYSKANSTYMDAVYDIDGYRYHAYGLKQSGYDLDYPIVVHYNPNMVSEAYCGDKPIGVGPKEYLFSIGTSLAVIILFFMKPQD